LPVSRGAILLIAAKRQDAIASAMAQHNYDTDMAAKAEIERLTKINEQQLVPGPARTEGWSDFPDRGLRPSPGEALVKGNFA